MRLAAVTDVEVLRDRYAHLRDVTAEHENTDRFDDGFDTGLITAYNEIVADLTKIVEEHS